MFGTPPRGASSAAPTDARALATALVIGALLLSLDPAAAQSFMPGAVPGGEFSLARRQTRAPANAYGPYRLTRRADHYGALYEDPRTGDLLYRQVYPETDRFTSAIPVQKVGKRRYRAEGFAQRYSPDRRYFTYGHYRDGQPDGEWLSVSVGPDAEVPRVDYESPRSVAEVEALLARLCSDTADCKSVRVTYTPFVDGVREGLERSRRYHASVFDSTYYRAGERDGRSVTYGEDGELATVSVYEAGEFLSSRNYAAAAALTHDSLPEEMPLFRSPDCPIVPTDSIGRAAQKRCAEYAMLDYIYRAVRYPMSARRKGIQGKTVIAFVVEEDGSITEAQTLAFVSESLDREALRVVNAMPPWRPGRLNGEPVRVSFILPIQFKLE